MSKQELIEKLISLEYLANNIFRKNKTLEEKIRSLDPGYKFNWVIFGELLWKIIVLFFSIFIENYSITLSSTIICYFGYSPMFSENSLFFVKGIFRQNWPNSLYNFFNGILYILLHHQMRPILQEIKIIKSVPSFNNFLINILIICSRLYKTFLQQISRYISFRTFNMKNIIIIIFEIIFINLCNSEIITFSLFMNLFQSLRSWPVLRSRLFVSQIMNVFYCFFFIWFISWIVRSIISWHFRAFLKKLMYYY